MSTPPKRPRKSAGTSTAVANIRAPLPEPIEKPDENNEADVAMDDDVIDPATMYEDEEGKTLNHFALV